MRTSLFQCCLALAAFAGPSVAHERRRVAVAVTRTVKRERRGAPAGSSP
jgi:hypothetical protein